MKLNKEYMLSKYPDSVELSYYENVKLLDEINKVIVEAGHILLKKKESDPLRGRCDSFVVETKVHYPTDINLLYDAMRKIITLTGRWCEHKQITDWRQHQHNVRHLKRLMRRAQNTRRRKAPVWLPAACATSSSPDGTVTSSGLGHGKPVCGWNSTSAIGVMACDWTTSSTAAPSVTSSGAVVHDMPEGSKADETWMAQLCAVSS